jgi:hypothetical protein
MARKRKSKGADHGKVRRKQAEHDGSPESGRQAEARGEHEQEQEAAQLPGTRDQVAPIKLEARVNPGSLTLEQPEQPPEEPTPQGIDAYLDENEKHVEETIAEYVGSEQLVDEPKLQFFRVKDIEAEYPPLELVLLAGVTTLSFKLQDGTRLVLVDDAELNDAQVALNRAAGPLNADPIVEYIRERSTRLRG